MAGTLQIDSDAFGLISSSFQWNFSYFRHMNKLSVKTETQLRNRKTIQQYFELLDRHLEELVDGKTDQMLELADLTQILCVSQKHLIRIMKMETGEHPCHFYVQKIIDKSKQLLKNTNETIASIAIKLTYDPSNFTKFFKKYTGMTPSQYRTVQ